jgi:hypothetical protein
VYIDLQPALALEMLHAQRFDFGVPDDFVTSVQEFRHG